jgi:hypothetical protein
MRKIIMRGLIFMVAVLSASNLAEAGQAQSSWTTSVKISCDNTVVAATADVFLCKNPNCDPDIYQVPFVFTCGTDSLGRSSGGRFEMDLFEPWVFSYTINVRDQFGTWCSYSGIGVPVGKTVTTESTTTTVTCPGDRSPKLSVGRPH